MEEKKLGLKSVISVSVGLVIATSCLVSLGQGSGTIGVTFIFAMVIACLFNMTTIASLSELNALMPNTTGGLAQYTLACLGPFPTMISMVGGYLFCNVLSSGVEASIFAYAMGEIFHLPIPNFSYTVLVTVILLIANLKGVDMFAKIQDAVAYLMVGSMVIMGVIGMLGLGTGKKISQPMVLFRRLENDCFHDRSCILAVYRCRICDSDFEGCQKCQAECTAWYVSWAGTDLCCAVDSGVRISQLYPMGQAGRFCSPASAVRGKSSWKCRKNMDGFCGGAGTDQFPELCDQRAGKYLSGNGKNEYDAALL